MCLSYIKNCILKVSDTVSLKYFHAFVLGLFSNHHQNLKNVITFSVTSGI